MGALGRLASIVEQVAEMQHSGKRTIVVTSGAVGLGNMLLQKQQGSSVEPFGDKPWNADARAAAAVGQPNLMALYQTMFAQHGLRCAQLLVTNHDLGLESTFNNLRDTVEE